MARMRVAKPGYNAVTDGIDKMLIDTDFQTQLISFQGNNSVTVPSSAVPGQVYAYDLQLGSSIGFIPYMFFLSTNLNGPGNPLSNYYQFSPTTQPGSPLSNLIPGDPWHYYYMPVGGSPYNANYLYYITYLPSQGSPSSAAHSVTTPPFINVAVSGGDASTDFIQNLAWTTGNSTSVTTLSIPSEQTYVAAGTIASSVSLLFTFPHGLGYPTVFNGVVNNFIDNNYVSSASVLNFNTLSQFNSCAFAIDSSNFYYYFTNNTASSITISHNIEVHYFVQP